MLDNNIKQEPLRSLLGMGGGIAMSQTPPEPFEVIYDFSDPLCYSGSGNAITDLAGTIDATVVGATYSSTGSPAGYFTLNSASQGDGYIKMNSVVGTNITPHFTIEMWVRFNSVSGGLHLLDNRSVFGNGIEIFTETFNSNTSLRYNVLNIGGMFPDTNNLLATNTFYHFVLTQGGTYKRAYTNNSRTTTISSPPNANYAYQPFHFGISTLNISSQSASNIDLYEFRMYNKEFSISEVDARFQASRTKYGI